MFSGDDLTTFIITSALQVNPAGDYMYMCELVYVLHVLYSIHLHLTYCFAALLH